MKLNESKTRDILNSHRNSLSQYNQNSVLKRINSSNQSSFILTDRGSFNQSPGLKSRFLSGETKLNMRQAHSRNTQTNQFLSPLKLSTQQSLNKAISKGITISKDHIKFSNIKENSLVNDKENINQNTNYCNESLKNSSQSCNSLKIKSKLKSKSPKIHSESRNEESQNKIAKNKIRFNKAHPSKNSIGSITDLHRLGISNIDSCHNRSVANMKSKSPSLISKGISKNKSLSTDIDQKEMTKLKGLLISHIFAILDLHSLRKYLIKWRSFKVRQNIVNQCSQHDIQ